MMKKQAVATYKPKKKPINTIMYIVKLLIGILFISPLLVGAVFSLLPSDMLTSVPSMERIIANASFDNYVWVVNYIPIFKYLLNSLIVCSIIICSQVILSCMAAYAFSFFKFPGKDFIFNLVLVAMMVPAEVTVINNYLNVQKWGLVNTYPGLAITSLVGGTAIFMMRQYFLQIPKDLKEASVVDGCGDFRFLMQIAIPMAVPAIASLAITQFIGAYNMYFWPMLISQTKEMQTVQIGMSMLVGVENLEYGHILAGAMIVVIIPVIVFIIGQDYIIKGLSEGAVKG